MTPARPITIVGVGVAEEPVNREKLAALGSRSPLHGKITYRVAFWIPLPEGHRKRVKDATRGTVVRLATNGELQAIRDGVIEEVVFEVDVPSDPPGESYPNEFRDRMMRDAWWRLFRHRNGLVQTTDPGEPIVVSGEIAARDFERRRLVV